MQRIKQFLDQAAPPCTWLFYGDSITHGVVHTFGQRDYTQLFAERLRMELGRPNDIVINTAISGNATTDLLEGFDWRAGRFKPDVALIMIGMNDCSEQRSEVDLQSFEANLNTLCDRFDAIGTLPVLQTTCPILPGSAPDREPHFDAYMDGIRHVAKKRSLPLIDHTAYWHQHEESHYLWMSNEFHPNTHGHRAFAKLLFEKLDIWNPEDSPTCSLLIP